MSTAAVIAGTATDDRRHKELLDGARALAAPAALIETKSGVDLWRIGSSEAEDVPWQRSLTSDAPELRRIRDALAPGVVIQVKHHGQQTLFDLDVSLLQAARDRAGDSLARRVRSVFSDLSDGQSEPDATAAREMARTVAQAITALAIRDKLTHTRDFDDALAILAERFSGDLALDSQRLTHAASIIGENVAFDGLDAAVLSDVYEGAVISKTTRRHLGAFYTPPALARKMMSAVPIEEIAPSDRSVLDLACGSGTLLLAASDRLAASTAMDGSDKHQYVRERLFGFDQDAFAVELSRLALLLHALPQGNGWHVSTRDGLTPPAIGDPRPTVVVGNPPWEFQHQGQSAERASAFLGSMVRWCADDGFIAAVMPASWLTSASARSSRAEVSSQAELFEIWRLPRATFKSSDAPPCVVFFRKTTKPTGQFLYRSIPRGRQDAFFAGQGEGFPAVLAARESPEQAYSARPPALTKALGNLQTLGSAAKVLGGVPASNAARVGAHGGPYQFLRRSKITAPFGTVNAADLVACRYPDDFSGRGPTARPDFYLQPKVLVAVTDSVDSPKRTRAMLDEIGVIPRNSLVAVVPNSNSAAERAALAGVLGSRVVNAWLQIATSRQIQVALIKSVPLPPAVTWLRIAAAVRDVGRCYEEERDASDAIEMVEQVVSEAYGLDEFAKHDVETLAIEAVPATAVEEPKYRQLAIGSVLDVAAGRILLHIPGVTGPSGMWVAPPSGMPGALIRAGATFDVYGAENGLEQATYIAQEFAYLDDDALSQQPAD